MQMPYQYCVITTSPGELPKTATTKAVVPIREFEEQMKFLHEKWIPHPGPVIIYVFLNGLFQAVIVIKLM